MSSSNTVFSQQGKIYIENPRITSALLVLPGIQELLFHAVVCKRVLVVVPSVGHRISASTPPARHSETASLQPP